MGLKYHEINPGDIYVKKARFFLFKKRIIDAVTGDQLLHMDDSEIHEYCLASDEDMRNIPQHKQDLLV